MRSGLSTHILLATPATALSPLVAVIAGVLSWAADGSVPRAVLCGGGALVAWMALSVSLCSALGLLDRSVR
ncbi:hypothetical protein [Streptomyces axinellae]|uniref:Integral membrane protein n=1 Tax=Streptomyces axinellae TaxID=552788 RepID=A0ABP6C4L4_9ACTN